MFELRQVTSSNGTISGYNTAHDFVYELTIDTEYSTLTVEELFELSSCINTEIECLKDIHKDKLLHKLETAKQQIQQLEQELNKLNQFPL